MITQNEINNLPLPPQEWIDDINVQEIMDSIKILEEYDNDPIDNVLNIHENIRSLMKLNIKQLKKEIKTTKNKRPGFFDRQQELGVSIDFQLKLNQLRNGKITKKGLVKNLIISYYQIESLYRGEGHRLNHFEKGIEYLVDLVFDDKGL